MWAFVPCTLSTGPPVWSGACSVHVAAATDATVPAICKYPCTCSNMARLFFDDDSTENNERDSARSASRYITACEAAM